LRSGFSRHTVDIAGCIEHAWEWERRGGPADFRPARRANWRELTVGQLSGGEAWELERGAL